MNDDWRLRIKLGDKTIADELTETLRAHEIERDVEQSYEDRIVVSVDGTDVFCYAATRELAERAQALIEQHQTERGWTLEFDLAHWHPTAERWEEPETPLPQTDAEMAEERRVRIAQERRESADQGYPDFDVRVQCAGHAEANELADRLRQEGTPFVHRWTYVLIGAADEESAGALADRLRSAAPPGSQVSVEGSERAVYEGRPWRPFWVLGGLAG
jgi:hypothetical protein